MPSGPDAPAGRTAKISTWPLFQAGAAVGSASSATKSKPSDRMVQGLLRRTVRDAPGAALLLRGRPEVKMHGRSLRAARLFQRGRRQAQDGAGRVLEQLGIAPQPEAEVRSEQLERARERIGVEAQHLVPLVQVAADEDVDPRLVRRRLRRSQRVDLAAVDEE